MCNNTIMTQMNLHFYLLKGDYQNVKIEIFGQFLNFKIFEKLNI